ncbi:acetyl-CoA carboxylase biotin carboxyl carrier protein subunit [Gemmobacter sp.]|uniref:acetyl-CoA carboxylase biotin carboxyl carrier protein subunit n=1 Tax=Gemmobacter sp. TaxID=1898957 RepID=UPI003A5992CD
MDCTVTEIAVALGDLVDAGQPLVILEAMKMQMPMKAGMAGIVAELSVRAGQAVRGGELLVRIEPQAALAREGGPA